MAQSALGWILLAVAAAVPGLAALLFEWDRVTLSKQYFWLAIAAVLLWSAMGSLRKRAE